jgi:molecular chaperone DnaK
MSYHLGVDLGTTYTAAAIARDGRAEAVTLGARSVSIPSVVCLVDDRLLVGEPAARRAVTDPQRVAREFKRRVGDPTPLLLGGSPVAAELCMARLVEWVVATVSATEGAPPASLALTHPANWGEYKLDLLRQAVRHVGLDVDHLVPEPVAAATAYAAQRPLEPGTVVAVYDLGGGTFDVALVRAGDGPASAQIIGRPDGIERLGGIDFDHAVFQHVVRSIGLDVDRLDAEDTRVAAGLAQLREECVEAKEALSHETDVSIPVMLPERHTEVRLTRGELESMIRPALDETVVGLRRAVDSADVEVADVSAVLLVGGSSRIPLVGQLVGAELGRPIAVDARPKDAISVGAALVAASEASEASGPAAGSRAPTAPMAAMAPPAAAGSMAPPPPTDTAAAMTTDPGRNPQPPPPGEPATHSGRYPATPQAGSAGRRRALVGVLAVVIALTLGIGGTLLVVDDQGSSGSATTTTAPDGSDDDPPATTADTTAPESGLGDPGDLGGLSLGGSTSEPEDPLPGDDWNDAARVQFVEDCAAGLGAQAAFVGGDGEALCGCLYDDAASSRDFDEFNAMWSAEGDVDTTDPEVQWLTGAIFACTTATTGV